jgi:hypothetical protein
MNFTNWTVAPIKNYGVDYEIDSYVDLQFNFSDFYDYLNMLTKSINNLTTSVVDSAVNSTVNSAVDWIRNQYQPDGESTIDDINIGIDTS